MMNTDPVIANQSSEQLAENRAENRDELIREFVETNPDYYRQQFARIGARAGFTWTFNMMAALLGPIWYGMRGLWNWGLPFVILETFAYIQIARGSFGDLGADARDRIAQIEGTLAFRHQQLEAAISKNADNVDVFRRTIKSLETAISDIQAEIVVAEANAVWIVLFGLVMLVVVKAAEGVMGNPALESRFSQWLSDRSISFGLDTLRTGVSAIFVLLILAVSIVHFAFPGTVSWLAVFPTDVNIRLTAIKFVEQFFEFVRSSGQWAFDFISHGIRVVLDGLEVLFVATPWPVIASFIILLTWLSAGFLAALASGGFLAYMGLFGFWEKAMTTLALLGTAACISITPWNSTGAVLRPAPAVLCGHPSDHGLHADHAVVRVHDPGDCLLQCRQTGGSHHHDDFRRHTGCAPHGARHARGTGSRARSRNRLWRVEMVPADPG